MSDIDRMEQLTKACEKLGPAFSIGFMAYSKGQYRCPFKHGSADAQAWEAGFDLAERYFLAEEGCESCG